MENYRHIQAYVVMQSQLLEGWEKFVPPYERKKTHNETQHEAAQRTHIQKWMEKFAKQVDKVRVARIEALLLSFYSPESKPEFAVAPEDAHACRISLDTEATGGGSVALAYLRQATKFIAEDDAYYSPSRVSMRTIDGAFERHLIRGEAMATRALATGEIPGALYYANPTLSLSSLLGPSTHCDNDVMLSRLRLHPKTADPVAGALQQLLEAFALAGFNRHTLVSE